MPEVLFDLGKPSVEILEEFFELTDSGKIFDLRIPEQFTRMRSVLREALTRLLVWERPQLESRRGVMWPYDMLRERYHVFNDAVCRAKDRFVRRQARLFLGFLPFPKQWQWLSQIEGCCSDDPEVSDFSLEESREISRKLLSKSENHYKLRHFCQVLKAAIPGSEKGVLRIFSLPYLFVRSGLLEQLSSRYVLYVEPPMGIVFRHFWWRHFLKARDPCLLGVASEEDIRFLNDQENMVTVQMAHGDFLEDIAWNDSPSEKDYDIVFNGTFDEMPRKRHQLMLHLLHHPLLRRKNILFLGRGQNREVEAFKKLVDQEGLGARVTVAANLRRSDIPEKLRCCRIGVHLSLYENACRSIYEFFRSNLPCVASSCMGGMNSQVFNSKTGVAVADGELAEAIALVLSHRDDFEPRRWFLENSGSLNSTKRLNQALRSLFEQLGYDWSSDIVRLGSSGANRYVARSDYERFMPDFEWLLNCLNSFHHQALTFSIE